MGRSTTFAYRVEYITNIGHGMMGWKDEYGHPDKNGLENWRQVYNTSFQPGGVNAPSDKTSIVPHITHAKLIRQSTNEIVAETYAPTFEIT